MYAINFPICTVVLYVSLWLQLLPLTRALEGFFFSLFEPEFSWTSINSFHGFARVGGDREDREGSLIAKKRAKTYKNNFERRRLFKLLLLRWRITLLKQWVLCELSEIAELNVLYSLRNGFQVVCLLDCMKTREPWTNCQEASINSKKRKISHRKGKKFPLNGDCFWK